MSTLLYDSTFEGLMTAVFEVFEYKYDVVEIVAQQNYSQENFFAETHEVITDFKKSDRVLKKLEENLGKQGISQLMMVYFSERSRIQLRFPKHYYIKIRLKKADLNLVFGRHNF